jgi:hypothetical protein
VKSYFLQLVDAFEKSDSNRPKLAYQTNINYLHYSDPRGTRDVVFPAHSTLVRSFRKYSQYQLTRLDGSETLSNIEITMPRTDVRLVISSETTYPLSEFKSKVSEIPEELCSDEFAPTEISKMHFTLKYSSSLPDPILYAIKSPESSVKHEAKPPKRRYVHFFEQFYSLPQLQINYTIKSIISQIGVEDDGETVSQSSTYTLSLTE